jgi:hypothetical protein
MTGEKLGPNGLKLPSSVPTPTTDMLYNEGGVLKFAGTAVSGAAHKTTHEDGGADEISVAGLSGLLADAQTPAAHNQAASTINSGTLDGDRLPAAGTSKKGAVPILSNIATQFLNGQGGWATPASGSTPAFVTVGPTGSGATYECDGTNDQVQINQALAASNYVMLVAGATYHIGAKIDYADASGKVLDGMGSYWSPYSTTIYVDSASIDAVDMAGLSNVIKNVRIMPNSGVTMNTGTYAIVATGSMNLVENVYTDNMETSVHIASGVLDVVRNCDFNDICGWGIINFGGDCTFTDIAMWGQTTSPDGGLYAEGCANLMADRLNIMACGQAIHLKNVMAAKITDCYFDQGSVANVVEASSGQVSRHISFIDCWFAGVGYAAPVDYIMMYIIGPGTLYDVQFTGGQFRDGYRDMVFIGGAATKKVVFNGVSFTNGGRGTTSSIFNLAESASHISIVNCKYNEDNHVNNVGAVYTDNSVDYVIHSLNDWSLAASGVTNSLGAHNVNANNL